MSERKKALISPLVNKFSLASRKVSRQIVFIAGGGLRVPGGMRCVPGTVLSALEGMAVGEAAAAILQQPRGATDEASQPSVLDTFPAVVPTHQLPGHT